MNTPRLEIDCAKIVANAKQLISILKPHGISIVPVTKVFMGHPAVAASLILSGVKMLADSRIENIERMRHAGITIPMMLIRTPMLSQVERVVLNCEISLNTELIVIRALSKAAKSAGFLHGVIVMVELGDLREGIMPDKLFDIIRQTLRLSNITLKGIGANLTCRYGVAPQQDNMDFLAKLAKEAETLFGIRFEIISGGNSANLLWALDLDPHVHNGVNQLRLGEAIYFGVEALYKHPIAGAHTDIVTLVAEVIESNIKPSIPKGRRSINAFGEMPQVIDRGQVKQGLLALGRQDVNPLGIIPPRGITIVASCSDHLVVESAGVALQVGQEIRFKLDYSGLLSAMTSPYVSKYFYH
ncbi:alanine/ornithine racemase family PLP-dependent enzyme [Pseudoalteromonas sp. S16_S37]|uniref:alanine/ornithine racemase family PLP-dependent enzyme n=1 Tax=Pseudoalteromonas sp. S16_S37 TaxID=2720228 RepID=UPI0016815370|nr:alanine/ornithine racemase family PLP-dependent enzyme [Pseudoalteromonas sp. S16_S37]MBD1583868.1 alanine/ornithine racemase family PLP-dependent enzyme [Pseudoalteromonas sp. S16_S37]